MVSFFQKKSSLEKLKKDLNDVMPNSYFYNYLVKPLIKNIDIIIVGSAVFYFTKSYVE